MGKKIFTIIAENVCLSKPVWNTWIFQIGEFVMEKKDIKNLETYPIWKIESGRMLHKFELFTEDSRILHRAIPTVSID